MGLEFRVGLGLVEGFMFGFAQARSAADFGRFRRSCGLV